MIPQLDSPRLGDYLLRSPGRPQRSLGLEAYWFALILMDIRALGPLQENYTLAEPGERRVRIRSERAPGATSGQGGERAQEESPPAHGSHRAATRIGSEFEGKGNSLFAPSKLSEFGRIPPSRKFWWYGPPP
ncbi:Hypothetical predicted protein [Marmota monax]|uniref:Uncharacterized protein n=1 Tax=Marmota monax TaxID=9995 RepID=A0A5E4DCQ6_MARMO|nr:Hypothetical predicted protein [Marmota monax]